MRPVSCYTKPIEQTQSRFRVDKTKQDPVHLVYTGLIQSLWNSLLCWRDCYEKCQRFERIFKKVKPKFVSMWLFMWINLIVIGSHKSLCKHVSLSIWNVLYIIQRFIYIYASQGSTIRTARWPGASVKDARDSRWICHLPDRATAASSRHCIICMRF